MLDIGIQIAEKIFDDYSMNHYRNTLKDHFVDYVLPKITEDDINHGAGIYKDNNTYMVNTDIYNYHKDTFYKCGWTTFNDMQVGLIDTKNLCFYTAIYRRFDFRGISYDRKKNRINIWVPL